MADQAKPAIKYKPRGKLAGKVKPDGTLKDKPKPRRKPKYLKREPSGARAERLTKAAKEKAATIAAAEAAEAARLLAEAMTNPPEIVDHGDHKPMVGRPKTWDPKFVAIAKKMTELGAQKFEVAEALGVDPRTLSRWETAYPEFCQALKVGTQQATDRVEASLFRKAVGFEYLSEKVFCNEGIVTRATVREIVHPDNTAAIFWLKNKRPEVWRDRHENVNLNMTMEVAFDQFIRERQFGQKRKDASDLDVVEEPIKRLDAAE